MELIDKEIKLKLDQEFTSVKSRLEALVKEEGLNNANIVCWVPHEVSSLIQVGWEDAKIVQRAEIIQLVLSLVSIYLFNIL